MRCVLSFAVAIGLIASARAALAQGHVVMTPEFVEANRKYTTYAPLLHYPASALARRAQGSGIYLLSLRSDGTVERVDIVKSTGYRELDDLCVATYKQWRFRQSYVAKVRKVKMPVTFTLPR